MMVNKILVTTTKTIRHKDISSSVCVNRILCVCMFLFYFHFSFFIWVNNQEKSQVKKSLCVFRRERWRALESLAYVNWTGKPKQSQYCLLTAGAGSQWVPGWTWITQRRPQSAISRKRNTLPPLSQDGLSIT